MTENFIIASLLLNTLLAALVLFQRYRSSLALPLFSLAILLPVYDWLSMHTASLTSPDMNPSSVKLMLITYQIISIMIMILTYNFLRPPRSESFINYRITIITLATIYTFSILLTIFFPCTVTTYIDGNSIIWLNTLGTVIIIIQCVVLILSLFILENKYRFALDYQKKIARFCFLSLLILTGNIIYYSGRLILFRTITVQSVEMSAAINILAFPLLLIGLLRYRLGTEHVSIPRNTVYSSFSLLLIGSLFCGAGITAYLFQIFKIDLVFFDKTLLVISVILSAILVGGSGSLRKRIISFVNKQFYTHKYDYRDQFFRLHRLFVSSESIETTIDELIDNMKFAVTVDDAFLFFQDPQSGNFILHHNKEATTNRITALNDNNPLIGHLISVKKPIDIYNSHSSSARHFVTEDTVLSKLKIDSVFPIFSNNSFSGILAIRRTSHHFFDSEDTALIEAFSTSIGETILKHNILDKQIRQKQFESFSQISSFIVHDIKNQISTLSLLVNNIEKNINNPDFQKSMIKSLQSCTQNMQLLIDKLQSPLKKHSASFSDCLVSEIIEEVISTIPSASMPDISVDKNIESGLSIHIDKQQLYYILKNLFNNSIEAMNRKGRLTIKALRLPYDSDKLPEFKNVGETLINQYSTAISIQDTGIGMSDEFINEKLFRPFNTTKDKGIGIGLYQCKTLVENMGGRILVYSKINYGTIFCILLK